MKSIDNFYKQRKSSKTKGEWIYYNPECKECTKKKSTLWRKDPRNRESYLESQKKRNKNFIYEMRLNGSKRRAEGKHKEWQKLNKDKIKKYNLYRSMHKEHIISEEEWEQCKEFFNYSCAYCGMDEYFAIETYGNELHKEHVDHGGANDISNCVPACKQCNSKKWKFELNDWYNEGNPIYSKVRYNKIVKWLLSFSA